MSPSAARGGLISIGTEGKLLFTGRTGVHRIRGLGAGAALAQGQSKTAYPESGVESQNPPKCCHPIHGRKAVLPVIVANEVPDQGSWNQADAETGQTIPCRSCWTCARFGP